MNFEAKSILIATQINVQIMEGAEAATTAALTALELQAVGMSDKKAVATLCKRLGQLTSSRMTEAMQHPPPSDLIIFNSEYPPGSKRCERRR